MKTRSKLLEAKEHTDDEIVDYDEIDLQAEYDKLNELLFGGSLRPVTMLWNNRKTAHGVVKGRRERTAMLGGGMTTTRLIINSLQISKFLDVPYKIFKDTLAHEMIHVKLLQNGIDDGHGPRFHSEMNRINSMGHGFNVSVKLDSGSFAISKNIKEREMVLIILNSDRGENMVAVTSPSVFAKEGHLIEELYKRIIKTGKYRWVKGEFYKSSNPELQRFTNQRTFRTKFAYQKLDDQKVEKLKADSELIGTFDTNASPETKSPISEMTKKHGGISNFSDLRNEIRYLIDTIF